MFPRRYRPVRDPVFEKDGVQYKLCTKCEVEKPVSEFHMKNKYLNRYWYECKECRKAMREERKKLNEKA